MRMPYFRRNDLHGPDAVAAARGNRGKGLAAALCAFAGVADDLDDVFGQVHDGLGRGGGLGAVQDGVHADSSASGSAAGQ
jgi:hypothetical protein